MPNRQKARVLIKQGKHGARELPGMAEAVEEVLEKAGYFGEFKALLAKQVRGSVRSKKVTVGELDPNTFGVLLLVQANGKDSKYECIIYVPGRYKSNANTFVQRLRDASLGNIVGAIEPEKVSVSKPEEVTPETKEVPAETVLSGRRSMAKVVFKDESLLKVSLQMLNLPEKGLDSKLVLKKISELGLACSSQGALKYFLQKEYLTGLAWDPKKCLVTLAEKGKQLIGKSEPAPDEDLLAKLRALSEGAAKHQEITQQLEALTGEEERLNLRLQQIPAEKENLEQQLFELAPFSVEYEGVLKALGVNK